MSKITNIFGIYLSSNKIKLIDSVPDKSLINSINLKNCPNFETLSHSMNIFGIYLSNNKKKILDSLIRDKFIDKKY